MMRLCILGIGDSRLNKSEIVYKSKKVRIIHLASMRRVNKLFNLSGLCATQTKSLGVKYSCCGRVSLQRNGKTTIGFILDEVRNKWLVHLCRGKKVMVKKVPFINKM